jgi:hypothetical protein
MHPFFVRIVYLTPSAFRARHFYGSNLPTKKIMGAKTVAFITELIRLVSFVARVTMFSADPSFED